MSTTKRTKRFDLVRAWHHEREQRGWWHSFELPDGTRIEGVNSVEGQRQRLAQFPIPDDLHGKRILDIGAWDGWFSFEMERRGAEVMAVDVWDNPRFREMHELLGSKVDYRIMDVYDLSPARVGRFDFVLFLAVLYHLKHPLLALERVCSVTSEMAAVDSFVLREEHRPGEGVETRPVIEFYESDEFGGQTDNWVGPSLPALMGLCRTAGFARAELRALLEHSACIACYRRWGETVNSSQPAPKLTAAFHNTRGGLNFSSERDEYVTIWFEVSKRQLTREQVQPEVAGWGTKPIALLPQSEQAWQANFKLPPGLPAGWHPVDVRIDGSARSNTLEIAVNLPVPDQRATILSVADATTGLPGAVRRSKEQTLALWVTGLPRNADQNTVRVTLDDYDLPVTYVEYPPPDHRPRELNVAIPSLVLDGPAQLRVIVGRRASDPVPVRLAT
jgi:tRNA (mo5U34)-methyltransferase